MSTYKKKGDGRLSCYGSTLGLNPDLTQNTKMKKMGDKSKGAVNTCTLARQKNIQNIIFKKRKEKMDRLT
jgi:hypothetical protein